MSGTAKAPLTNATKLLKPQKRITSSSSALSNTGNNDDEERDDPSSSETIFISGLNTSYPQDDTKLALFWAFSRFGSISAILTGWRGPKRVKGCAWITFDVSSSAQEAYLQMNGFCIFGSFIVVEIAKSNPVEFKARKKRMRSVTERLQLKNFEVVGSDGPTSLLLFENATYFWTETVTRLYRGFKMAGACECHKGTASFVQFESEEDAARAKQKLSKSVLPGGEVVKMYYAK